MYIVYPSKNSQDYWAVIAHISSHFRSRYCKELGHVPVDEMEEIDA